MAFKVIDGGGPRSPDDFDVRMAAQTLRYLTIELMRALARGDDPKKRITAHLIELYKHLGKPGMMVDTVVNVCLREAYPDLTKAEMSDSSYDDADREIEHIVLAGLQVAAETLCWDDAAQGRTSQRLQRLDRCLTLRQNGLDRRRSPRAPYEERLGSPNSPSKGKKPRSSRDPKPESETE